MCRCLLHGIRIQSCPPESAGAAIICALCKVAFVYVQVCGSPAIAQPCCRGLILVISCPDRIAEDTVFAPARGQKIMCVFAREQARVGAQAGRLAIVFLSVCCEAKRKMIATGGRGREEIDVGGILKASGEACTHINTDPAYPLYLLRPAVQL